MTPPGSRRYPSHRHGSHPPARRIEALGIPVDDTLLTPASHPLQAEETAFTEGLFTDWASFRQVLGDNLLAVAVAHDRQFQARLEEAAGAMVLALPGLFVAGPRTCCGSGKRPRVRPWT